MSTNALLILLFAALALAAQCPNLLTVQSELGKQLSNGSTIGNGASDAPRWSLFGAPTPMFVVNVTSEKDVATTVKYCNQRNLPFVTQNGGNGWAITFDLGKCGVIINIASLQQIAFNADKTLAIIQGGVHVKEMVDTAYANDARFATASCNCVGFLGAALGGGLTRVSGLYGLSVDQIRSMNVVLASGEAVTVTARSDPDLWWALRGAAPNFGIVTSAIITAHPVPRAANTGWVGPITFSEDKLEAVISTIDEIDLKAHMQIDLIITTSGAPAYAPIITAVPLYTGNASAASAAFASLLKVGPLQNNATVIPYPEWSTLDDFFCARGDRKPAYGVSGTSLHAPTWRAVFKEFKAFVSEHGGEAVGRTSILAEKYALGRSEVIGNATSSYPYRDLPLHIVAIPWYTDASLDPAAEAWGTRVRDQLRSTAGVERNSTYINFAHGDESLETIYGNSLGRLQRLKKRYDPQNRFNQWFPLERDSIELI